MSTTATSRRQTESTGNWITQHPLVSAAIGFLTLNVTALLISLGVGWVQKRQQAAVSPANFKADAERIAKNPWWSPGVGSDQVAYVLSTMAAGGPGSYVVSSDGSVATVSDPERFEKLVRDNDHPTRRYTDNVRYRMQIGEAISMCSSPFPVHGNSNLRFVIIRVYGSSSMTALDSATSRHDAGYAKFIEFPALGLTWYNP